MQGVIHRRERVPLYDPFDLYLLQKNFLVCGTGIWDCSQETFEMSWSGVAKKDGVISEAQNWLECRSWKFFLRRSHFQACTTDKDMFFAVHNKWFLLCKSIKLCYWNMIFIIRYKSICFYSAYYLLQAVFTVTPIFCFLMMWVDCLSW